MEDKDNYIEQTEDLTRILADIEIINMVKKHFKGKSGRIYDSE